MASGSDVGNCTICLEPSAALHSHHTIPRSRGGENSQQIDLCGNCHTLLHSNALHIISRMRNPKRPAKYFWKNAEQERRAEPWLKILVHALVTLNKEAADITEHLVGTTLSSSEFQLFKLLASDLGCSQEKAVEYCIQYVLRIRGFKNEKTTPELWFMPVSKP